jgi:hypothetical protein
MIVFQRTNLGGEPLHVSFEARERVRVAERSEPHCFFFGQFPNLSLVVDEQAYSSGLSGDGKGKGRCLTHGHGPIRRRERRVSSCETPQMKKKRVGSFFSRTAMRDNLLSAHHACNSSEFVQRRVDRCI